MENELKFLGIAGSIRAESYNVSALRAAQELLPSHVTMEIFPLNDIPIFSQDIEMDAATAVVEMKQKIREADAIVFATPEYNYSIPGVLKNAIDWGSRPYGDSAWEGKPAAIMGASVGNIATARAQYDLRKIMVFLNMFPLNKPEVMIGGAKAKFDSEGRLIDEPTREHIRKQMESLANWTRKLKG